MQKLQVATLCLEGAILVGRNMGIWCWSNGRTRGSMIHKLWLGWRPFPCPNLNHKAPLLELSRLHPSGRISISSGGNPETQFRLLYSWWKLKFNRLVRLFVILVLLILWNNPLEVAGGFALAWQGGVDFEVTSISHHILNLLLYSDPGHVPWMVTLVYGPTLWHDKR